MSDEERSPLESFASRAIRRNKAGAYEFTLSQHLIRAVASPPIEKIRLVCEGAYMIPEPPVDLEKLDVIYRVVTSFTTTEIDIHTQEHWGGILPWAFDDTEENYHKYIAPWIQNCTLYTAGKPAVHWEKEKEYNEKRNELAKTNAAAYFWFTDRHWRWHLAGVENLKARFTVWAMPETMRIFEALSRLVSADVYTEMMERVKQ